MRHNGQILIMSVVLILGGCNSHQYNLYQDSSGHVTIFMLDNGEVVTKTSDITGNVVVMARCDFQITPGTTEGEEIQCNNELARWLNVKIYPYSSSKFVIYDATLFSKGGLIRGADKVVRTTQKYRTGQQLVINLSTFNGVLEGAAGTIDNLLDKKWSADWADIEYPYFVTIQ